MPIQYDEEDGGPMKNQKPTPAEEPVVESVAPVASVPVTAPVAAPIATLGVDSTVAQVKSLLPADASSSALIIGAVALAGIAAAFKLGPQALKARTERAEQAHELEMERLKLEREKQDRGDDQHKACAAERAVLQASLTELSAKVQSLSGTVEKQGSTFDLESFNPEDIEKRLKRIEKKFPGPGRPKKVKANDDE